MHLPTMISIVLALTAIITVSVGLAAGHTVVFDDAQRHNRTASETVYTFTKAERCNLEIGGGGMKRVCVPVDQDGGVAGAALAFGIIGCIALAADVPLAVVARLASGGRYVSIGTFFLNIHVVVLVIGAVSTFIAFICGVSAHTSVDSPHKTMLAGPGLLLASTAIIVTAAIVSKTVDVVVAGHKPLLHRFKQVIVLSLFMLSASLVVAGLTVGHTRMDYKYDDLVVPVAVRFLDMQLYLPVGPRDSSTQARKAAFSFRVGRTAGIVNERFAELGLLQCHTFKIKSQVAAAFAMIAAILLGYLLLATLVDGLHAFSDNFSVYAVGPPVMILLIAGSSIGFDLQSEPPCPMWGNSIADGGIEWGKPLAGPTCLLIAAITVLVAILVQRFVPPSISISIPATGSIDELYVICCLFAFALSATNLAIGVGEMYAPAGRHPGESTLLRYYGLEDCPCVAGIKNANDVSFSSDYFGSYNCGRTTREVDGVVPVYKGCSWNHKPFTMALQGNSKAGTSAMCPEFRSLSLLVFATGIIGAILSGILVVLQWGRAFGCAPAFTPKFFEICAFLAVVCTVMHFCAAVGALHLQMNFKCDMWTTTLAEMPNFNKLPGPAMQLWAFFMSAIAVVLLTSRTASAKLSVMWHTGPAPAKSLIAIALLIVVFALGVGGLSMNHSEFRNESGDLVKVSLFDAQVGNSASIPLSFPKNWEPLGGYCQVVGTARSAAAGFGVVGAMFTGFAFFVNLSTLKTSASRTTRTVMTVMATTGFFISSCLILVIHYQLSCESLWPSGLSARRDASLGMGANLMIAATGVSVVLLVVIHCFKDGTFTVSVTGVVSHKRWSAVFIALAAIVFTITCCIGSEVVFMANNACCVPKSCSNLKQFRELPLADQDSFGRTDAKVCRLTDVQREALGCDEDNTATRYWPNSPEFCKVKNERLCVKKPLVFNLGAASMAFSLILVLLLLLSAAVVVKFDGNVNKSVAMWCCFLCVVCCVIILGLCGGGFGEMNGGGSSGEVSTGMTTLETAANIVSCSNSNSKKGKKKKKKSSCGSIYAKITCSDQYGYGDEIFDKSDNKVLQRWNNPFFMKNALLAQLLATCIVLLCGIYFGVYGVLM